MELFGRAFIYNGEHGYYIQLGSWCEKSWYYFYDTDHVEVTGMGFNGWEHTFYTNKVKFIDLDPALHLALCENNCPD